MKHLMYAALAATLAAAPAVVHAQTTLIGGLRVTVLSAPACDFGVPWPDGVINDGDSGPAAVNITRGSTPVGSDPFVGTDLAGLSPYLSLSGSHDDGTAVYWRSSRPQHAMQILWGTPDSWNRVIFYDQTGRARLGELNGAEINRRFNHGAEAPAVALLIESAQPFYAALAGTHGHAFEFANVAFDAQDHCR